MFYITVGFESTIANKAGLSNKFQKTTNTMKNQQSNQQNKNYQINYFMIQSNDVLSTPPFALVNDETVAPPSNMWSRIEKALNQQEAKTQFANSIINSVFDNQSEMTPPAL